MQDAHRAGDVIKSFRTLAGKSEPQFTQLNLNDAIEEVLALTRSDLQRHSVALRTDPVRPVAAGLGGPGASPAGAAELDHERYGRHGGGQGQLQNADNQNSPRAAR